MCPAPGRCTHFITLNNSNHYKAVQKNHPIDKCLNSGIQRNVCLVDLFSERATSHVEAEDALIKADISTPMNIIKFRPIFVDLNGNKTANTYFNIACLNPQLVNMKNTDSILKALDFSISNFLVKYSWVPAGTQSKTS